MLRKSYLVYLIAVAVAVVGIAELGLSIFGVKPLQPVADVPPLAFKIAIFGESTAAGAMTGVSFAHFLLERLHQQFPTLPLSFHNFALPGNTFHKMQAELVKREIKNYDVIVILAGHNEYRTYTDGTGYFRSAENKNARELDSLKFKISRPYLFLANHSRLFAIADKLKNKFNERFAPPVGQGDRITRFKEFESEGVLPEQEKMAIGENFRADLLEIAQLAKAQKKRVVFASLPINYYFPPYFSVLKEKDDSAFHETYSNLKSAFDSQDFKRSVKLADELQKTHPGVAVVSYLRAKALWKLKKPDEAFTEFRKSADEDGFPIRSLSNVRAALKEVGTSDDLFRFVDLESVFNDAQKLGVKAEQLFEDPQHPSYFGTYLMGLAISEAVRSQILFTPYTFKMADQNPNAVVSDFNLYRNLVNLTLDTTIDGLIAFVNFAYSVSGGTSYQKEYLSWLPHQLDRIASLAPKIPSFAAMTKEMKALVEFSLGNLEGTCTWLNEGLKDNSALLLGRLEAYIPMRGVPRKFLEENGFHYSEKENKFFCPTQNKLALK